MEKEFKAELTKNNVKNLLELMKKMHEYCIESDDMDTIVTVDYYWDLFDTFLK